MVKIDPAHSKNTG